MRQERPPLAVHRAKQHIPRMTRVMLIAAAAGLLTTPALAQTFDPAAQRLEMERVRAQTELNAASAAGFRSQSTLASQQLQASVGSDGGIGATVAQDAQLRAEAERRRELDRRAQEDAARDLERRVREARTAPR